MSISDKTIANWKKKYPDFLQALKVGKIDPDEKVERSLYERAVGYSHRAVKILNNKGCALIVPYIEHVPPDVTACIFWLKNRRKEQWRDKHEVGLTDEEGNPLAFAIIQAAQNRKEEKTQDEKNPDTASDGSK